MNTTPALAARGVRKSFGERLVLDDIDLTVPPGSVAALLGPNGAGKTTLVRILSTLLRADGGSASVLGFDVVDDAEAVRAHIGLTGQFSAVDELLTGEENLMLMADLCHLRRTESRRRVAELIARLGLADHARQRVSTYSGGLKRRVDVAMTLVGRPRVIFLDEPTTGLDPRSRRDVWDIVRQLVGDGTTILLTTQYLEEAEALADTVAILDGGRIVADDTPAALKASVPGARDLDDVFLALTGHAATANDDAANDDDTLIGAGR